MKNARTGVILSASLAIAFAVPASASELVDSSVVGMKRACSYATANPAERATLLVGVGEACPTHLPSARSSLPAPPTARLTRSDTVNGQRNCTYSQGASDWSLTVPLNRPCPIAAGMVRRRPPAN